MKKMAIALVLLLAISSSAVILSSEDSSAEILEMKNRRLPDIYTYDVGSSDAHINYNQSSSYWSNYICYMTYERNSENYNQVMNAIENKLNIILPDSDYSHADGVLFVFAPGGSKVVMTIGNSNVTMTNPQWKSESNIDLYSGVTARITIESTLNNSYVRFGSGTYNDSQLNAGYSEHVSTETTSYLLYTQSYHPDIYVTYSMEYETLDGVNDAVGLIGIILGALVIVAMFFFGRWW